MARAVVTLNQNTSTGAAVATWQDAGSQMHQMVVLETQTGAADPVAVGTTTPLPVASSVALPMLVTGNVPGGGADSGNGIKISGVFNTAAPTFTNGQRGDVQIDAAGNLKVNIVAGVAAGGTSSVFGAAFPANGTAMGFLNSAGTLMAAGNLDAGGNLKINIAAGGVPSITDNTAFTAGTTAGLNLLAVFNDGISNLTATNAGAVRCTVNRILMSSPSAAANGGATPFTLVTSNTTNQNTVKSSAGQIYGIQAVNIGAPIGYLKIFDKATAPTLGTDSPVFNLPIPGNTSGAGAVVPFPVGTRFANGIQIAVTAGIALLDTAAQASANLIALNLQYA